ncbi:hypothetical protein QBC34DRAFT_416501 [Podospora aff. communis PSN243]|uniref:F-box domain-containing protein n=1 Tax=Podospora aff. communis PSN243 TaxID=3040156 RepID=A0AAV9G6M4_9PEZI|nr:hypothetical protein QBC34DRAFT_416501 [Podospora aff. communis PSN243]
MENLESENQEKASAGSITREAASRFFSSPELLLCLAEQLDNNREIRTLCLTSRTLHTIFTPLLYKHLTLDMDSRDTRLFHPNNPHLQHSHHLTTTYPSRKIPLEDEKAFTALLASTPNLHSLKIHTRSSPLRSLNQPLIATPLPHLTHLHVGCISLLAFPDTFTHLTHFSTIAPNRAWDSPIWRDNTADILLQCPQLKVLVLDFSELEAYMLQNPASRRDHPPFLLDICLVYVQRGVERSGARPSALSLKGLVVSWGDPPSINGKVWEGWVHTVGGMVDFGSLEVLRLGSTSAGEDSRYDLLTTLTSDLVPRLRVLVVPHYTRLVHDWVMKLEPEFARRVAVRYLRKVGLKGGTGVTMADLFVDKRVCELRMVRLEFDVEESRGRKMPEILERLAATNGSTLQLLDLSGLRLNTSTRESLATFISKLVCIREIRFLNFVGLHPRDEPSMVEQLARSQLTLQDVVLSSRWYHVLRRGSDVLGTRIVDAEATRRRGLELYEGGLTMNSVVR